MELSNKLLLFFVFLFYGKIRVFFSSFFSSFFAPVFAKYHINNRTDHIKFFFPSFVSDRKSSICIKSFLSLHIT